MSELIYSISTITLFELHCGQLKEREKLMLEKTSQATI